MSNHREPGWVQAVGVVFILIAVALFVTAVATGHTERAIQDGLILALVALLMAIKARKRRTSRR